MAGLTRAGESDHFLRGRFDKPNAIVVRVGDEHVGAGARGQQPEREIEFGGCSNTVTEAGRIAAGEEGHHA